MNAARIAAGLLAAAAALGTAAGRAQPVPPPQRVVDQGIGVDFSAPSPARAGEPLSFSFQLADTASNTPLRGLRPAAWLSLRAPGAAAPDCRRQVAGHLGGNFLRRAEVDMNRYYVLALNDDASISVVDPLFGFGGSKLLALLSLPGRGADWALSADEARLFVALPEAGQVAVADTREWRILRTVATGPQPHRVLVAGSRAWVADGEGVSAIEATTLAATPLRLGAVADLAASSDGDLVFAASGRSVAIIDAQAARVVARVPVDGAPTQLAYSAAAQAVYALDAQQGRVFAIDARRRALAGTLDIPPGATQIRFAPDGRHALIPNPREHRVQVLDAASNRIVQAAQLSDGPDRVSFSDLLAYVRRRGSEIVQMIPLDQLGAAGRGLGVAEFPGGQHAPGDAALARADTIVRAPEGPAVLVANPGDRMIYLYKEGMAAPAGGFSTYGRRPQAVLVVDRGLREAERGRYATRVPVERPGTYDVAMFVNAPRVAACFELTVAGGPVAPAGPPRAVALEPPARLAAGAPARLRFALNTPGGSPVPPAADLRARAFRAPGVWQQRAGVALLPDGSYAFDFLPPEPGTYYVWLESASLGLVQPHIQFQVFQVD
jgi:hypothetical protein